MKLSPEQLASHVAKQLAPVYLVHGDEPLLLAEAADQVRAAARQAGYSEREVFHVEAGFEWGRLTEATSALSLFAQRRLLELRLPQGKPGDAGSKALIGYAQRPPPDTVLLVLCGKLEAKALNSQWAKALDQAGIVVPVWPVKPAQLPRWIQGRLRARGLEAEREAIELLAERVEGNLLACAQEIDKLQMRYGGGRLDTDTVAASVADSARYSVYDLGDAALAGQPGRIAHVLAGLQAEGTEATLVLWVLARELRLLVSLARAVADGQGLDRALAAQRVWDRRKPLFRQALGRYGPQGWEAWLAECGRLDRMAKGVAQGRVWDELLELSLGIGGQQALREGRSRLSATGVVT